MVFDLVCRIVSVMETDNAPTTLCFTIRGQPRPKQSARWVNGRARAVTETNATTKAWALQVRRAAGEVVADMRTHDPVLFEGDALAVRLVFTIGTDDPARQGRPHTAKPDADNLAKLVLDELGKAGMLPDGDQAVADLDVRKRWGRKTDAGCIVRVDAVGAQSVAEGVLTPPWLGVG